MVQKNNEKRDVTVAFHAVHRKRMNRRLNALLPTVLTVEALDTSGGIHDTLATGPERVR